MALPGGGEEYLKLLTDKTGRMSTSKCLVSITQTGRWTSNRKSAREQLAPGSGDSETG